MTCASASSFGTAARSASTALCRTRPTAPGAASNCFRPAVRAASTWSRTAGDTASDCVSNDSVGAGAMLTSTNVSSGVWRSSGTYGIVEWLLKVEGFELDHVLVRQDVEAVPVLRRDRGERDGHLEGIREHDGAYIAEVVR